MAVRNPAPDTEPVPAPAPEIGGSGASCSNCGEPAIVTTDGKVANAVSFCAACKPDNIEAPPAEPVVDTVG